MLKKLRKGTKGEEIAGENGDSSADYHLYMSVFQKDRDLYLNETAIGAPRRCDAVARRPTGATGRQASALRRGRELFLSHFV